MDRYHRMDDNSLQQDPSHSMVLSPVMTSDELDAYLMKMYQYYYQKGFTCILVEKIANLLIYLFMVAFVVFWVSFVNYSALFNVSTETPFSKVIDISASKIAVITWIISCGMLLFWVLNVVQFIRDLPELFQIREYYLKVLRIPDINHVDWNFVAGRIIESSSRLGSSMNEESPLLPVITTINQYKLNEINIAARILRRDNYIVAMFNHNIFKLSVYTKPMEWFLTYAVWNYLFDPIHRETIRPELLKREDRQLHTAELRNRMMVCGIVFFILSPVIVMYLLVYYLFAYFDQIRNTPAILSGRLWSRYALWKFREFNELSHYFDSRLAKSQEPADKYLSQFPSRLLPILGQLVSFMAAAFFIVILLLGFISDDTLLQVTVFDRSLLYYVGIFGIILTATRGLISNDAELPEHQKYLLQVSEFTHYRPKCWIKAHEKVALDELKSLYQYRLVVFLQSMMTVLTGPFILLFRLPAEAEHIVEFIQDFTVYDDNLGYICSAAAFEHLESHGNVKYGAPVSAPKNHRTKHGKMEKSMITFKQNHPQWQPPESARKLLDNVREYLELSEETNKKPPNMIKSLYTLHDSVRI